MGTYFLKNSVGNNDIVDFTGKHIKGNLVILSSNYYKVILEGSTIEGNLYILDSKSEVNLSKSLIGGSVYIVDCINLEIDLSRICRIKNTYSSATVPGNPKELDIKNLYKRIRELGPNYSKESEDLISELSLSDNTYFSEFLDQIASFTMLKMEGNVSTDVKKGEETDLDIKGVGVKIISSEINISIEDSEIQDFQFLGGTLTSGTFNLACCKIYGKFEIRQVGIASDLAATGALFNGAVCFDDIRFDNEIHFKNCIFLKEVTINDCTFYQEAYFQDATFNDNVTFKQAIFQSKLSFRNTAINYDKKITIDDGSAFFGYVDMKCNKGVDLSKFEFKTVRGLRNIFYSLIEDDEISLKFNFFRLQDWKDLFKKDTDTDGKGQSSIRSDENKLIKILLDWKNKIEQNCSKYTLLAAKTRQIEMFNEGRRAMEDVSNEGMAREFHILTMDASRQKHFLLSENWKTLKLWILKVTTNYGESILRLIGFIFVDFLFFSIVYFIVFQFGEYYYDGNHHGYNAVSTTQVTECSHVINTNVHESDSTLNLTLNIKDWKILPDTSVIKHDSDRFKNVNEHFKYDNFYSLLPNKILVHNQFNILVKGMIHSYNNLLSFNSIFYCSCHPLIMGVTFFQGFLNLLIFALMAQIVIRKLEVR